MSLTLVNVAFGVLLGAALLGAAFDRRSVLLVAFAAALPDVDAALSLLVDGATNAVLHSLWIPLVFGAGLYWDTERRPSDDRRSWLRSRYGWRGVRVAWVVLAGYAVAGIGFDLFAGDGVNLLYPVIDQFYVIDGKLLLSSERGLVQTFVGIGDEHLLAVERLGTTADHRVDTWIDPGESGDRRLYLVRAGWQAIVVAAAATVLFVRSREGS